MVDNPDGQLTPGLFAKVRLETGKPREQVLVADHSIGTDQGRRYVLVVDEGNKTQYRPVELGPMVDGLRVVRQGLQPGERIVVRAWCGRTCRSRRSLRKSMARPSTCRRPWGRTMTFPRFFIDRPIFAIVLSVLMMIGGIVSFFQLPLSEYPAVTPPTVQVTTAYPGANPDVIAQTVATPLEQAITGVEGCCTCPRSRPPTGE